MYVLVSLICQSHYLNIALQIEEALLESSYIIKIIVLLFHKRQNHLPHYEMDNNLAVLVSGGIVTRELEFKPLMGLHIFSPRLVQLGFSPGPTTLVITWAKHWLGCSSEFEQCITDTGQRVDIKKCSSFYLATLVAQLVERQHGKVQSSNPSQSHTIFPKEKEYYYYYHYYGNTSWQPNLVFKFICYITRWLSPWYRLSHLLFYAAFLFSSSISTLEVEQSAILMFQ